MAVGLLISFVGTFAVMWQFDVSLNMISMAAFILVLGIVVDDAIVVAESIHHKQRQGEHGEQGAISGVTRVATPVIFAVLTSIIVTTCAARVEEEVTPWHLTQLTRRIRAPATSRPLVNIP